MRIIFVIHSLSEMWFPDMSMQVPSIYHMHLLIILYCFKIRFKMQNIPTIRYQYQNDSNTRPPFATLQNGFYYATDYWIYSKIDMEGIGEPIKLDGLQWVTPEEEEDLETNCNVQ